MAQVRKLKTAGSVPEKVSGNIEFNGNLSEFSDNIYNSLVKKLDTSAASGIIRKGFDLGKKQGNTFHYDSSYNRAYVTNEHGEKIWDYQGDIGSRSNFKVKMQGTFGRENLHKNPNDVNRLLQSVMSNFTIPSAKEPDVVSKSEFPIDNITIQLTKDNRASIYDQNYTDAYNRLEAINKYYTNPDDFLNEYDFGESNSLRQYLDHHKQRFNSENYFGNILSRVSNGNYTDDDELILNTLGITLKKHSDSKSDSSSNTNNTNSNNTNNTNNSNTNSSNNSSNTNSSNNSVNTNPVVSEQQSANAWNPSSHWQFYTPNFIELSDDDFVHNPEYYWKQIQSYNTGTYTVLKLTNSKNSNYYAIKDNDSGNYANINNNPFVSHQIAVTGGMIKDVTHIDPTNFTWSIEQLYPGNVYTLNSDGSNRNIIDDDRGKYRYRLARSLDNKQFFAMVRYKGNGVWVSVSKEEYYKLKDGTMRSVPSGRRGVALYNSGGRILKMQGAGNVPDSTRNTVDRTGTIYGVNSKTGRGGAVKADLPDPDDYVFEGESFRKPIGKSAWVPYLATMATMTPLISYLTPWGSNPIVRKWTNGIATAGFGTNLAYNLISDDFNWGNTLWSLYGLSKGFSPTGRAYKNTTNKPQSKYVKVAENAEITFQKKPRGVPKSTSVSSSFPAKFNKFEKGIVHAETTEPIKIWIGKSTGPNSISMSEKMIPKGVSFTVSAKNAPLTWASRFQGTGSNPIKWGLRASDIISRGLAMGYSFPAMRNFMASIASDPEKTFWDPTTWTKTDMHNFQIGATGLNVLGNAANDFISRYRLSNRLASTHRFWKNDYITDVNTPKNAEVLKIKSEEYPYTHLLGSIWNPYKTALHNLERFSFSPTSYFSSKNILRTNPGALGFTGGLAPWSLPHVYQPPVTNLELSEELSPKDSLSAPTVTVYPDEVNNTVTTFKNVPPIEAPRGALNPGDGATIKKWDIEWKKNGGRILKMQGAGNVPDTSSVIKSEEVVPQFSSRKVKIGDSEIELQDIDSIRTLLDLKESGIINDEEFKYWHSTLKPLWNKWNGVDTNQYNTLSELETARTNQDISLNQYNTRKSELETLRKEYLNTFTTKSSLRKALNNNQITKDEYDSVLQELTDKNAGAWSKTLQKIEGDSLIPTLEGLKVGQSIRTTKKNNALEKKGISIAEKLQYISGTKPIQQGYDFSSENISANKAIAQLNSQMNNFSKSTSDNLGNIVAFNTYGSNLSEITENTRRAISDNISATKKFNIAGMNEFDKSELARTQANNAVSAKSILQSTESDIAANTQISKDVNSVLSAVQNWKYKDNYISSDLTYLYQQKQYYTRLLYNDPNNEVIMSTLKNIDAQIADARKRLHILPKYRLK